MTGVQRERPWFTEEDAVRLAGERFGIQGRARELPSYQDRNFLVEAYGGGRYVLKVVRSADEPVLTLEDAALEALAARGPLFRFPRVEPAPNGDRRVAVEDRARRSCLARMVTFLEGRLLARHRPHPPALLRSAGSLLGALDTALEGFSHPAAERAHPWDLARLPGLRPALGRIEDPGRRDRVERVLDAFEEEVLPRWTALPASVIHNDGNDFNLLVTGPAPAERRVTGIVDFGDMVRTATACEPAVAAAYAALGKEDPLAAAAHLVAGYHDRRVLSEEEVHLLFPLIQGRLVASVLHAARRRAVDPENDYLAVSESPAWDMLARFEKVPPAFAEALFRRACGYAPWPAASRVRAWLERRGGEAAEVIRGVRGDAVKVFDLSPGNAEASPAAGPENAAALAYAIDRALDAAGAKVGVGRYGEVRLLYQAPAFTRSFAYRPRNPPVAEGRNLHLGIDLFAPRGTEVRAPLDGIVAGLRDNADALDYGPTVILTHAVEGGAVRFHTLYGHLDRASLEGLAPGRPVKKGALLGRLGGPEENGGWPPHLHFQVICHLLGFEGDFPGTARPSERALWEDLCPDPNLLLRVPEEAFPPPEPGREELLAERRRRLGPSLSLAYTVPLVIVRGRGAFLYDAQGRAFLDLVNNVCHVGHCHPRVVQALARQAAVLNTNTRYLHGERLRYAGELAARFPPPLEVCFFTCSGSEANELALRMARTCTGGTDFVVLDGAYHGNTGGLIDLSPYKFDGPGGAGAPPHVRAVPMPDRYRGPYGYDDPAAGPKYAETVREAFEAIRADGRRPAAFVCESLMGCGGQIVLPPGYLEAAYRHARAAGALCIADEVQVGFGRVGERFWGFETQGVVPDVVTLGKPMGNGHPLAGLVTTRSVAEGFAGGMEYFNTYGGNPVACAVGRAVLSVIEEEGLQEHARVTGAYLKAGLEALAERHPVIGDVRGLGLFLGVELVEDRETRAPATARAAYVIDRCREEGVLLSTDGPLHNVLKIKPPLALGRTEADLTLDVLDRILAEDLRPIP